MNDGKEVNSAELAAKYINQTNRSVFLTGKAGTGKTTFLRKIIEHTHKNAIIVAPTGIAAINAGGVTIHSQFGLPFGAFIPDSSYQIADFNAKINTPYTLLKHLNMRENKRRLLQELELLIIDEVSMLRADVLDMIDFVLKQIRKQQHKPFGGVQLLFIGDLMQLPPVIKEPEWLIISKFYQSIYFFDAKVLQQHKPIYIELEKIYRQTDSVFINLLNHLRNNIITQADVELLNSYYKPNFDISKALNTITLTTHNYKADEINKTALQQLNNKSFFYKATIEDEFNEYAYPVDALLELKVGAQVMFVKNDQSGRQQFFNGKIATVSKLTNDNIEVDFKDGSKPFEIPLYEWKNIKYELNKASNEIEEIEIGKFIQFPIKTAWAITVHKSQGLTFENAILDINRAFAPGQVYVALSRLKSLNGLILTSPIQFASIQQDKVLSEYVEHKPTEEELKKLILSESKSFLENYLLRTYDFVWLDKNFKEHIESYQLDKTKSVRQKHKKWAENMYEKFMPLAVNALKFKNQLLNLFHNQETDYLKHITERHIAAKNYFYPVLKELSRGFLSHIELLRDEKQIKTYLEELLNLENLLYKHLMMLDKTSMVLDTILNNTEFNKQKFRSQSNQLERLEAIKDTIAITKKMTFEEQKTKKKTSSSTKKVKEKTPKPNTKEESYTLYKKGLSIENIANTRKLSLNTIETHLAYYVSLGLINVTDFVDEKKVQTIIECATQHNTTSLSTLKQELGEEASYSEIKFVMASRYYLNKDNL